MALTITTLCGHKVELLCCSIHLRSSDFTAGSLRINFIIFSIFILYLFQDASTPDRLQDEALALAGCGACGANVLQSGLPSAVTSDSLHGVGWAEAE